MNVREVLNGIFYILWTGYARWRRRCRRTYSPKSTVHDYLELWNWDGTLERLHHALYVAVREQEGREGSPTVAIIDSKTAKGAQKGGLGLILRATTRAKKIQGSQAAHPGRHAGSLVERRCFILPMFRTMMGHFNCCAGRDDCSHSLSASSLTVAMPGKRWRSWSAKPEHGSWRS